VFEIKLCRILQTSSKAQITPQDLIISKLSIIDLAGSERANKSHTTGDRLKEASNINSSLTVLSRCIETLRTNQHLKPGQRPAVVPFRESKLTHLLRNNFYSQQEEGLGELLFPLSSVSLLPRFYRIPFFLIAVPFPRGHKKIMDNFSFGGFVDFFLNNLRFW
jgi:hypothetical protein